MLQRHQAQDQGLSRRQPLSSAYAAPSSQLGRTAGMNTIGGGSSSSSLNMRPARVVGTGGTAYEAMCKRVLGRRLLRAFSLAFFASMAIWTTSLTLTGGLSASFSFGNLLRNSVTSAVVFLACVLPTLVLRKILITQPELTTSSAVARLRAITSLHSSRTTALVFAVCGGLLAFFWSVVMQLSTPSVKLGVFASTSKHPVMLNERYIVVLLSNISLGVVYASRELWQEAFLPKWPRDILPLQGLILSRLFKLPPRVGLPILHSFGFSAVYLALRRPILRFLLSWFGVLVRPYVATFLRPSHRSMDLALFGKIVALELTTVALWGAGKALLDVYMVQPMLISHHSASPTKCLLAGLQSSSAYFRHFAQFELAHLVVTSPARRADIFSDMSTPNTAWAEIWRSEMVLLGQSYQKLLARGAATGAIASVSATASSSGVGQAEGQQEHGSQILPKADPAIFKHAKPTVADSLSSTPTQTAGPIPPAQPLSRALPPSQPSSVPAIFTQRPQATPAPAPAPARSFVPSSRSTLATIQLAALGSWSKVWSSLPAETRATVEGYLAPARRTLVQERVRGSTRRSLPHRNLDVLIIQTLSALTSASLAEDPYGQVQRDIPRTLEALTSYLTSLEGLYGQLQATASVEGQWPEEGPVTMAVLKEDLEPALDASREGIRQIVETFREHLSSAFRFPPHVVQALEQFID